VSVSEGLFERARKLIPGGVNSPVRAFEPYPFFVKRASGSRLYDVDGREYVDYCMGYGPLILGHAPSVVVDAVKEQLGDGTLYGAPSEQEVELAELVCKVVPCAEMVRLVSTGGEATMSAIRLARGFTGRRKVLKFEGSYHGAHDSVLVKAGSGAETFGVPDSLGVPEETSRNTVVVPYNDVEAFEAMVKRERSELAAVIVEPVMGNVGVVLPKDGFLETLREVTERFGVVLVFDEVITGFRLALGGAQEFYCVEPDLTSLGKVMGGGFPLAAFAGHGDIMRLVAPSGRVYQAGTFSGNPISVAAGLATLRFLRERRGFYSELERKCSRLVKGLEGVAAEAGLGVRVNGVGSMFQLFLTGGPVFDCASAKKSDVNRFVALHRKLMGFGVFVPPSQFETCFLSSAHTDTDLKLTVDAYRRAFEAS
jgi:glutamate-1-semialdehyde 2,1-aminomutase